MAIEPITLRGLLDQLETMPKLLLMTIVWARHHGGNMIEFRVGRDRPEPDGEVGEWESRGCLEAILRRGL